MYPISIPVREAFASGAMQYARITVTYGDETIVIDNSKIRQGGLTINRYCTTGETVDVGSCVAAEMTLVLNNKNGEFDNVDNWIGSEAFVEIGIEVNSAITYIPMGYFIFDSLTWASGSVTLNALDRLILFEKTIGTLTFPMTLSALLSACCTACGVTLAAGSLTNGSYTVSALPEEARTYRDLLRWIFEIAGCCGYINRSGALAFAWYSSVVFDITQSIRKRSTLERQGVVITGVEVTDGDDVYTSGLSDRMIRINNNPLLKSSQQLIADSLYQKCGGLTYTPFEATIVPSPQLFILDMPSYYFADGSSFTRVAITEMTYRLNGYTEIAGKGGNGVYPHGYGLSEAILNATNIKGGTLPPNRIGDSAITGMKIAAQAVTEGKIAANAVTEGKIAANAVVADKIASGAVTADKIAANAVTAGKILAGAVTADKIDVSDLFSLNATIGNWEITQNALRKIVTIGEYDYQIILYAPSSPQLTTSAIAIQRRATGTSDAWASVTRITFAGKLISNDAEITGVVNSGSGSIGGWTISQTGLSKVITSGQYDYQVILYTLSNATSTSTAIAVQRRATGTSDAWASVTRITYGGKLISNDAEITGTINSEAGEIGGWEIDENRLHKSVQRTVATQTVTRSAGLNAPSFSNVDAPAFYVHQGDRVFEVSYDGVVRTSEYGNFDGEEIERGNTTITPQGGVHSFCIVPAAETPSWFQTDWENQFDVDVSRANQGVLTASLVSQDKRETHRQQYSIEATVADMSNFEGTDITLRAKDDSTSPYHSSAVESSVRMFASTNDTLESFVSVEYNNNSSRLSSNGLTVKGVDMFTPTSGSGTRNTTNTTGGVCDYWKIGKVVVVSFRQLVPAVTTADAILFTGLPNAVADTSFPAIATTARGAGRLYVDTSGRIKIGGNMSTAGTYLGNFTYVSA